VALPIFKLEEYLGEREFVAPFSLCSSDMQSRTLSELLALADVDLRQQWETLSLGYSEPKGLPALRQEVSQLYSNAEADQILMFAGAEEGIYCAAHALLEATDHAIVIMPCYQSLAEIPRSLCELTLIPLDESRQWSLDLDQVKAAIQPNTKLIVVNFPHNPTGTVISRETQEGLIAIARQQNAYIFSDEVYRLLELDETNRLPAMVDAYEKGISLAVMSKAYGLAGLRIGWIATRDRTLLKRMEQIKHYLSICNSVPSELLSLIALRAKDTILQQNHEIMRTNLQFMDQFFEQYSDWFQWNRPIGGCVGFPRLIADYPVETFAQHLLDEEGVLILPANMYDWAGNNFRISYGRRNMPEALERFERFVQRHCHSWSVKQVTYV
jgi:aspartate/methionine/tyrosine aminotransferase